MRPKRHRRSTCAFACAFVLSMLLASPGAVLAQNGGGGTNQASPPNTGNTASGNAGTGQNVNNAGDKARIRQQAKAAAAQKQAGVTAVSFERPVTFPADI